jgi:hypothetical protein
MEKRVDDLKNENGVSSPIIDPKTFALHNS